jgi:hypothetical protein
MRGFGDRRLRGWTDIQWAIHLFIPSVGRVYPSVLSWRRLARHQKNEPHYGLSHSSFILSFPLNCYGDSQPRPTSLASLKTALAIRHPVMFSITHQLGFSLTDRFTGFAMLTMQREQ